MSTLQVIEKAAAVERALVESGGEFNPEIEAMLGQIDLSQPEAVDAFQALISRFELLEEHYAAQAAQRHRFSRAFGALSARYKNGLKSLMVDSGKTEIVGNEYRYKLSRLSADKIVFDEASLPLEFFKEKITHVPDRDKIAAALEAGTEIEGARIEPVYRLSQAYPLQKVIGTK